MHDGYIPPDFNRAGPLGDLVDPTSGGRIGDVEWYGGWVPSADGTAIRDVDLFDPLGLLKPIPIRRPQPASTDVDDEFLLLY